MKMDFQSHPSREYFGKMLRETVQGIQYGSPYYYRNVIKAKSCKGAEQDVLIMGFRTAGFALAPDADFIYKSLKNLFDHRKNITVSTLRKESPFPSIREWRSISERSER